MVIKRLFVSAVTGWHASCAGLHRSFWGSRVGDGPIPRVTAPRSPGVQWALPYASNTKGTAYDVSVVKYNCANAQAYVRTLVKEKVHSKLSGSIPGGPLRLALHWFSEQDRTRLHR